MLAYLIPGESSIGSIAQKDMIHKRTRNHMNGGGQGC